jgi:hypothetical protein
MVPKTRGSIALVVHRRRALTFLPMKMENLFPSIGKLSAFLLPTGPNEYNVVNDTLEDAPDKEVASPALLKIEKIVWLTERFG